MEIIGLNGSTENQVTYTVMCRIFDGQSLTRKLFTSKTCVKKNHMPLKVDEIRENLFVWNIRNSRLHFSYR